MKGRVHLGRHACATLRRWLGPVLAAVFAGVALISVAGPAAATSQAGTTYTVNTTDNTQDNICSTSHCSLLDAWYESEHHAGKDTIAFNIPGSAPHVIHPSIGVVFGESVDVLGETQPDSSPGHPTVVIDGSGMAGGAYGELQLDGGHSTVRRLVINGAALPAIALEEPGFHGVAAAPIGSNIIEGNFIGTDWTGAVAVPTGGGIAVPGSSFPPPGKTFCSSGCDGAPNNRIGGPNPAQRNVIATHFEGFPYLALELRSSGNTVQGNFIGTDASGDHALVPPGASTVIIVGDDNQVGGPTGVTSGGSCTGPCNVITEGGLLLAGSNNTVQGNRIGTDATGTKSLGESNRAVAIQPYERRDEPCNKAVGNRVGGTEPGAGNVIAGSETDGVFISGYLSAGVVPVTCGPLPTGNRVEGNLIGTDVTGTTTDGTGRSFGNARGVLEDSGSGDVIGGPIAAARNVISGNAGVGVLIVDNVLCGCGNIVQGNLIGTDITGTKDLGNGFDGIDAGDANSGALRDTVIADNVVSGNGSRGLFVANGSSLRVVGNKIGTNATGTAAIPNDADGVEWLSPGPASSGGMRDRRADGRRAQRRLRQPRARNRDRSLRRFRQHPQQLRRYRCHRHGAARKRGRRRTDLVGPPVGSAGSGQPDLGQRRARRAGLSLGLRFHRDPGEQDRRDQGRRRHAWERRERDRHRRRYRCPRRRYRSGGGERHRRQRRGRGRSGLWGLPQSDPGQLDLPKRRSKRRPRHRPHQLHRQRRHSQ